MSLKLDSFIEVSDYFRDNNNCKKFLIQQRRNGAITCPHCKDEKIWETNRGYKCSSCKKKFTVTTGTVMENPKLPLRYWIMAIYFATSAKNGISAAELSRHLNVKDTTGWFLLQRIRVMFADKAPAFLSGIIQLDETFVGGKNKNRHWDKKVKNSQGRSFKDKTPVMGMLQQEVSEIIESPHKQIPDRIVKEKVILQEAVIRCHVVADTSTLSLQPLIRANVKSNSIVISDEWFAYRGLDNQFQHKVVDHASREYVNKEGYTSNTLEGGWSIFKKAIIGTHHQVTRKHLQLYVDEFAYRYNTKNMKDGARFIEATTRIANGRLKYKELVA
jgi:transposase-like protein